MRPWGYRKNDILPVLQGISGVGAVLSRHSCRTLPRKTDPKTDTRQSAYRISYPASAGGPDDPITVARQWIARALVERKLVSHRSGLRAGKSGIADGCRPRGLPNESNSHLAHDLEASGTNLVEGVVHGVVVRVVEVDDVDCSDSRLDAGVCDRPARA